MPTNGFFVHSVSVLISVKTTPSTDSALKALLTLNPSTCVRCRDIQMRHDNTHDLHGSVNSWICHTSKSHKLNFSPLPSELLKRVSCKNPPNGYVELFIATSS